MVSNQQIERDQHFMQYAIDAATEGLKKKEVPVGAVIVLHGEVLAVSHNETHASVDPTGHAEVLVLRKAALALNSSRLDGATLYVSVEPCLMCSGALLQARIDRLVFGCREPRTGGIVSISETLMNPANTHHISVIEGVLADSAAELMQTYFKGQRASKAKPLGFSDQ